MSEDSEALNKGLCKDQLRTHIERMIQNSSFKKIKQQTEFLGENIFQNLKFKFTAFGNF